MISPEFDIVALCITLGLLLSVAVISLTRSIEPMSLVLAGLRFLVACGYALIIFVLFLGLVLLMGPLGIGGWFILAFVLIEAVRKYRATRQYGLLWLLTVSAERSMPLVPAIEAFAKERGGWHSRRTRRLAQTA